MKLIHIAAGLLALVAGGLALYAAKGSRLHRGSGWVFVAAMLTMTSSAVVIAAFLRPNRVNVVAGTVTFYLVSTGVLAMMRPVEPMRRLLTGLMLAAFAASAYALSLGIEALGNPKGLVDQVPAGPGFMFAIVAFVAAAMDARMLRAGHIEGAQRLVRHLWRMGFAMWIATASFFLGQAKVMPEPVRKIAFLATPVLLVLAVLVYWLVRVVWMRRRPVGEILGRRAATARVRNCKSNPRRAQTQFSFRNR